MGFHSPLIRPAISWGGSFGGGRGRSDSHDYCYILLEDWHFQIVSPGNLSAAPTTTEIPFVRSQKVKTKRQGALEKP